MNIFESFILGIVQGLTEFIPVSSSGHLELVPKFFNWAEPSTSFITFLHFGTLLALLIYYRNDLLRYLKSFLKFIQKKDTKDEVTNLYLIKNLIIATIPAAIIGFLLANFIEGIYDNTSNSQIAAIFTASAMIILGIIFLLADRIFTNERFSLTKLNSKKALFIGFAQVLALFRGTSRSGITLLAGQASGLDRVSSAEFGFLMSIPVTLAAATFGTLDLIQSKNGDFMANLPAYLVGLVTSFVFGYIAIRFMIKFLKKRGLRDFGIYRILFGVLALIILL